jgi:hypothetical protein
MVSTIIVINLYYTYMYVYLSVTLCMLFFCFSKINTEIVGSLPHLHTLLSFNFIFRVVMSATISVLKIYLFRLYKIIL